MKTNHQSGHIILVVIAGVALVGIVWLGHRVITKLKDAPLSTTNNQDTNLVEWGRSPFVQSNVATVSVTMPEWGVTNLALPVEALTQNWYFRIQTSSNLIKWEDTDLEWIEALESVRTNRHEVQRFFRRVLVW